MAAARKALRRRPVAAAARLSLIVFLASGLAALTLVAAPARAEAPAPTSSAGFVASFVAPAGEEARGIDRGKDWRHCVQVVANLRAEAPEIPVVVLLGGSSARECTVLDEHWERQIERRSGYTVDAYNLGSKHRTYAQDLEFVKLLPRDVPTIVYIGVNLGRFCIPPDEAAIRLPSPAPIPYYPQHFYSRTHIQTAAEKRSSVSSWLRRRYPEFRASYKGQLAMLERIIRECRRRHLRVALLDLPLDLPIIGSAFDAPVARYHDGCSRLARDWSIPWIHYVGAAGLVNRDFFDIFHLVEPGRVKYQSILSDRTIRLLRKYRMPKPAPTPSPSPTPTGSPSPAPSASAAAAATD